MLYCKRFFPYYSTTFSAASGRTVSSFLFSPQFHYYCSNLSCQERVLSIHSIQSGPITARLVEPPVLLSPSPSPSSTISQASLPLLVFILQKLGRSSRSGVPSAFIAAQCVVYRDRFIHECDRASHRSKLILPLVPPIEAPPNPVDFLLSPVRSVMV
jgi:hypothetical protein